MIIIRTQTREFIEKVERSSGKKFTFRNEIEILYELAEQRSLHTVFDDLAFYAKFIYHASGILKRHDLAEEQTAKLSREFKEKLEKASALIKTLISEAPGDVQQLFMKKFFSLSHESVSSLLILFQELSRIKNYSLDQERI